MPPSTTTTCSTARARTRPRPPTGGRSISHLLPAHSEFDPVHSDPVYSRYRKRDTMAMDDSFFPVTWAR